MEKKKIHLRKLKKNRYILIIDDTEEGIYTYGILLKNKLIDGKELDEEDVEGLYRNFIIPIAKERVLRLLSKRERSKREIEEYLKRKKYSDRVINRIIEDFTNSKLIDERRFAEVFVRSRFVSNPRGKKFIEYELKEKGIPEDVISNVLSDYDEEEALRAIFERVKKRYSGKKDKIIKYLLQRGFDYHLILKVVNGV